MATSRSECFSRVKGSFAMLTSLVTGRFHGHPAGFSRTGRGRRATLQQGVDTGQGAAAFTAVILTGQIGLCPSEALVKDV